MKLTDRPQASVAYSTEPTRSVVAESYLSGVTFGVPAGSSAEGSVYSEATHCTGHQQFNAWAPDGVLHRLIKAQTVVSERSTTTTATTTKAEPTITPSGWVKPVSKLEMLMSSQLLTSSTEPAQVPGRCPLLPEVRNL